MQFKKELPSLLEKFFFCTVIYRKTRDGEQDAERLRILLASQESARRQYPEYLHSWGFCFLLCGWEEEDIMYVAKDLLLSIFKQRTMGVEGIRLAGEILINENFRPKLGSGA